jgi:hypothetical protein
VTTTNCNRDQGEEGKGSANAGASVCRHTGKIMLFALLYMFLIGGCLDPYSVPRALSNVHYLVIEGFLNTGGPTVIRLSSTTSLGSVDGRAPEQNATVVIQDDRGGAYALIETDSGSYSAAALIIDPNRNYRLKIRTVSNKEYASDFVPFKQTPPIDSLKWFIDGNNLHVNVNTHDDNNNTHYYLWKYEETWSYNSRYPSNLKFENKQIVYRGIGDDVYHCWKTLPSTQILTSSSTKLARDIISNYTLSTLPLTSEKLQSEYSVLVHQVALTKEAFEYWQLLKKNTENIGTIFGPQPSEGTSNIHSITNPEEPVIGYFSASSVQQQRIFIFNVELPRTRHTTGYEGCELDTLFLSQIPDFRGTSLVVGEISKGNPPVLVGYYISSFYCVDCRLRGGTTVKPYFWK